MGKTAEIYLCVANELTAYYYIAAAGKRARAAPAAELARCGMAAQLDPARLVRVQARKPLTAPGGRPVPPGAVALVPLVLALDAELRGTAAILDDPAAPETAPTA